MIDITYPHTRLDLENQCVIGIPTVYDRNDEANVDIIGEANSMELVKALKNVESYQQSTNYINQYRDPLKRWRYQNVIITVNFKVTKHLE